MTNNNIGLNNNIKRFGTFKGVFLPSILTIFGVIMYLRMGWVLGSVGLIGTLFIITVASLITFITGLSISSTATNMKIKGGGAYFMISRSFGLETGAAVGIPLFLAQSLGVSFYIAGFAESITSLFPQIPAVVIGVITLIILTIPSYYSADFTLKIQLYIFIIIILSLVSFFAGGIFPKEFKAAEGMVFINTPFWAVFAVFFPAVTGIEAGISLSGDLENPSKSLPWGTLSAVLLGYIVYMAIPVFLNNYKIPREILISNQMIIKDSAFIGQLILLGIWGATLSSALGCILGAPRTLQALSRDRILPNFLGKGFGASDSPKIATIFTFIIALMAVLLGDLNALAPILTMFFLISYAVLNLSAGIETIIANPSWRPTFKTSWFISLLGTALCIIVMFMINPGATFIAGIVIILIFYIMTKRKLTAHWGDIRRSMLIFAARSAIYRLEESETITKYWRPNILVFCGSPAQRFYLIQLADAITHGKSFLTVSSIVPEPEGTYERKANMERSIKEFLKKNNVPAFVEVTFANNFIEGAKGIVKTYGLGALAPNTFMLGETEKRENYLNFAELFKCIYQSKRNIMIVREGEKQIKKDKDKKKKKICVWWGGKYKNSGLMLVLGYMLNVSPEWNKSELFIKTIIDDEKDFDARLESTKEFIDESRINAEIDVLIRDPEADIISTTIRNASLDADLVFMGMKPPEKDETPEEYAGYYEKLLERTKDFPDTIFVLASEDIKFADIFK